MQTECKAKKGRHASVSTASFKLLQRSKVPLWGLVMDDGCQVQCPCLPSPETQTLRIGLSLDQGLNQALEIEYKELPKPKEYIAWDANMTAHEDWCSPFFLLQTMSHQLSGKLPLLSSCKGRGASCFFSRLCLRSSSSTPFAAKESCDQQTQTRNDKDRPKDRKGMLQMLQVENFVHLCPVFFCVQSLAALQLGEAQWCPGREGDESKGQCWTLQRLESLECSVALCCFV